ncbi:MAG: hypothetical protein ABIQ90_01555, partial [Polaromonas sp.]
MARRKPRMTRPIPDKPDKHAHAEAHKSNNPSAGSRVSSDKTHGTEIAVWVTSHLIFRSCHDGFQSRQNRLTRRAARVPRL